MTEGEWLSCADPLVMVSHLCGPIDKMTVDCLHEVAMSRKHLLVACACFNRLGKLIPPEARYWPVRAGQAAEGLYDKSELLREGEEADRWLSSSYERATSEGKGKLHALDDLWTWNPSPQPWEGECDSFWQAERKHQAELLRHIFGNPFRPYPVPPSWPSSVSKLAEALYAGEDCSFALHDALLEAGHPELAEHFQKEQWHPKGCWVVDMILGKT